jgi:hypothetical protein
MKSSFPFCCRARPCAGGAYLEINGPELAREQHVTARAATAPLARGMELAARFFPVIPCQLRTRHGGNSITQQNITGYDRWANPFPSFHNRRLVVIPDSLAERDKAQFAGRKISGGESGQGTWRVWNTEMVLSSNCHSPHTAPAKWDCQLNWGMILPTAPSISSNNSRMSSPITGWITIKGSIPFTMLVCLHVPYEERPNARRHGLGSLWNN